MRVIVDQSYKTIRKLSVKAAPQITWDRVGTFQTSMLKRLFETLHKTGIEAIDVCFEGDEIVIEYPRGSYRLKSEPIRGQVHSWRPWFDLGATPECNETAIYDRASPEIRRKTFRLIVGGAA